jgi:hypothetical protein
VTDRLALVSNRPAPNPRPKGHYLEIPSARRYNINLEVQEFYPLPPPT